MGINNLRGEYAADEHIFPLNHGAEYRDLLGQFADVIQEIVRFGWNVIRESAQGPLGDHSKIVTLACYRHLLENLDGVGILIRQGSDGPAGSLLRSAAEALWAIEYIAEEESERRALCYHVEKLHRERSILRKLDSTTPEGQRVRAEMHPQLIIKPGGFVLPMPDMRTQTLVQEIDQRLQREIFRETIEEWTKATKKNRSVHWFSLFGGPRNLRELAIHLGQGEAYEVLYSDWSRTIHARDALRHVVAGTHTGLMIKGPREGGEPQLTTTKAIMLGVRATREILDYFRPDRREAYARWYLDSIKPRYDVIASEQQLVRTKE